MKFILSIIIFTLTNISICSLQAKPIKIQKETDMFSHREFSSIYDDAYKRAERHLQRSLFHRLKCFFELDRVVYQKDGFFRKGQFKGAFRASCANNVKDINLYVGVKIYDHDSAVYVAAEVILENKKKIFIQGTSSDTFNNKKFMKNDFFTSKNLNFNFH